MFRGSMRECVQELRASLLFLTTACQVYVDRNAMTYALGDDAEVLIQRFAAVESALIGGGETWCQFDLDPFGTPAEDDLSG